METDRPRQPNKYIQFRIYMLDSRIFMSYNADY